MSDVRDCFQDQVLINMHSDKLIKGDFFMNNKNLVLVVDDDPDIVEAISLKLESCNYEVITANDGMEAWDKIKIKRPDIIILDVMMPRKNGYVLCNELKQSEEYKDITVILLTSVADEIGTSTYTHMDGKSNLADDYIPKPVQLDKLAEIIREHLE